MRHFLKEKKNQEFQVFFSKKSILRFLSLRYSADFRRSRLVCDKSDQPKPSLTMIQERLKIGSWRDGTLKEKQVSIIERNQCKDGNKFIMSLLLSSSASERIGD